jgi:hypothetical protein
MHYRRSHIFDFPSADRGSTPRRHDLLIFLDSGALGALWEVCPKHRNIRRETQRVRSRRTRFRRPGKGFCSFNPALQYRPFAAEFRPIGTPRGGSCYASILLFMKQDDTNPKAGTLRAAVYVRMSTDHQKYSTENQSDAIREYAARRGIEIIVTYSDEGKSGLNIHGRASLTRMAARRRAHVRRPVAGRRIFF